VASADRIAVRAENDRNRASEAKGRHGIGWSGHHDEIDAEPDEVGSQIRQ